MNKGIEYNPKVKGKRGQLHDQNTMKGFDIEKGLTSNIFVEILPKLNPNQTAKDSNMSNKVL